MKVRRDIGYYVDTNKSPSQENSKEDFLHDHIIAAMSDGCRLYFLFDQILDTDLQPDPADFSITTSDTKRFVRAATLKAAVRKGKSWSLISLLLDAPIAPGTNVVVNYHPHQWFLWSLDTEEPVEPFEFDVTISDTKAVHGIDLEIDTVNLEAVPNSLEEVDAEAKIDFAFDRRVKITFGRELDITHQPKADDFRAELESSWLTIGSVHLARAGKAKSGNNPWPELWVMLRDPLAPGSHVQIGYKPPESGLRTADGAIVKAFRVSAQAASKEPRVEIAADREPAKEVTHQQHEKTSTEKPANIVKLFSEQDKKSEDNKPAQEYENPYSKKQAAEEEQLAEEEFDEEEFDEDDIPKLTEIADYEHIELTPVDHEDIPKPPRQIIRTYLTDGKSITLGEEELAAEAEIPVDIPRPTKLNYRQSLKQASPLVKVGVGAGFLLVGWFAAALLTFVIKLFGVSLSGDLPNTLAQNQTPAAEQVRAPCEMTYHDGSRYQGECLGKKRDGGGAYYWASGDVYKGDWVDDKQHGNGMLQYKNGDVYTGTFDNNRKHGMGAMHWANGARYQGGYQNGKFEGRGSYWSNTGTRFEGVFKDGHTTNEGTCYFPDNTSKPGACPQ